MIDVVRGNDGSIEQAAAYLEVPVGLVQAAVAYYGEYPEEIDGEIELAFTVSHCARFIRRRCD